MKRSFDPEVMREAVKPYPELIPPDTDLQAWLANTNNVMLVDNGSVGLAVCEYPGVYTGHYFYKVGGRQALRLAEDMMLWMIENKGAKAFTGITPADRKAARWFNRHLGFTSYGIISSYKGDHEMFCMTADELLKKRSAISPAISRKGKK